LRFTPSCWMLCSIGSPLRTSTTPVVSTVCRGVPRGVLTSRYRLRSRAQAMPAFESPRRVLPRDLQLIVDVGQQLQSGEARGRVEQVKPTHGIDSQDIGPLHHAPHRMLIPHAEERCARPAQVDNPTGWVDPEALAVLQRMWPILRWIVVISCICEPLLTGPPSAAPEPVA
jgi:hypothetical protein